MKNLNRAIWKLSSDPSFAPSDASFWSLAGVIPKGALTIADEGFAANKGDVVLYLVRVGSKLKY